MVNPPDLERGQADGEGIYKWLVLLTVCISNFMGPMDSTMVNIALPELTVVFNSELSTVIWTLLGYMLVSAGLMLTLGKLGDSLSRKKVYTSGFVLFTIGLGLSAVAQNITQLIIFRLIQGVGSAMTISMAAAIVTATFKAQERGKALGIMGMAVGLGLMSGPALGGLLLDVLGWRSLFYLRLPLSLLGVGMAWFLIKDRGAARRVEGFDIWGAITLFIGLGGVLFAASRGQTLGWFYPLVLGSGVVGAALLVTFIVIESRLEQPILDLSLLRSRGFTAANASLLFRFLGGRSVGLMMPFLLIQAYHYPASQAGLFLIITPLTMALGAPLSGWLSDRIGSRLLCPLGLGITLIGLYMFHGLTADSSWLDIVLRMLIMGIGGTLFETPNNSAIMGFVPEAKLGTASSMIATMRSIGQTGGLAIGAAVFGGRQLFHATQLSPEQSLIASFQDTILVALAISVLAFLTALVRGRDVKHI